MNATMNEKTGSPPKLKRVFDMIFGAIALEELKRNTGQIRNAVEGLVLQKELSFDFQDQDITEILKVILGAGIFSVEDFDVCVESLSDLRQLMALKGYDTKAEKDEYCIYALRLHRAEVIDLRTDTSQHVFNTIESLKVLQMTNQLSLEVCT